VRLVRDLLLWFAALLTACILVRHFFALHAPEAPLVIASAWKDGKLVDRTTGDAADMARAHPDAEVVLETVEGVSPILRRPETAFALSLVPGHDGVEVSLAGQTTWITPDDLLSRQAYDHGVLVESLSLSLGADVPLVLSLAAERLHTSAREVEDFARIRRIRVRRSRPSRRADPC